MKHRKQIIPLALAGVFVAAVLCGCGQQDTAANETQTSDTKDNQTTVASETKSAYAVQKLETGDSVITKDGTKVGGAGQLDCVEDVDIAAAFDTTQGASEQLEPILTSLFNLRLGYDAEKPDYSAGISDVADMEVSFAGTDGEETDYVFAKDGQYYVVWFQNEILTAGEQRSALYQLKTAPEN